MGHRLQQFLPFGRIIDLGEFLRQIQVIPADDAILDEPFAGFGHLLVFLLRLQEFAWIADRDRAREGVDMLDAAEHFFNGHAQHRLVDHAQNEDAFQGLAEGLQGLIQAVLLGIGIEPAEDIRGGRFLEFDRGDEAQDVVPELNDVLLIDSSPAA